MLKVIGVGTSAQHLQHMPNTPPCTLKLTCLLKPANCVFFFERPPHFPFILPKWPSFRFP